MGHRITKLEKTALNQLRKEFRAFDKTEVLIDVYSDRVVIGGENQWLIDYFTRRNVLADMDRGGVMISLNDAEALNLPAYFNTSRIYSCKDLRDFRYTNA